MGCGCYPSFAPSSPPSGERAANHASWTTIIDARRRSDLGGCSAHRWDVRDTRETGQNFCKILAHGAEETRPDRRREGGHSGTERPTSTRTSLPLARATSVWTRLVTPSARKGGGGGATTHTERQACFAGIGGLANASARGGGRRCGAWVVRWLGAAQEARVGAVDVPTSVTKCRLPGSRSSARSPSRIEPLSRRLCRLSSLGACVAECTRRQRARGGGAGACTVLRRPGGAGARQVLRAGRSQRGMDGTAPCPKLSQPVSHVWVLHTVFSTHHCTRPACGVAAAYAANRS
jgi:hypothetical protein